MAEIKAQEFVWWDNWTSKGRQVQTVASQIEVWLGANSGYKVKEAIPMAQNNYHVGGGGYYENCGRMLVIFEPISA